jgi:two-component system response regulator NreC
MITIVLADDHNVMRQGLRSLLEAEPDFQVIGEAGNGNEAIRLVENLHPDVLVLDMVMPDMNGVEVIQQLKHTMTSVVILSMFGTEGYVHKAMRSGAKAYVLKQATANELVHAIREVVEGRRYLSRALSERAIDAYVKETLDGNLDPFLALTSREREVLQRIASGCTSKILAKELNVSPRTIEFHRANIMRKLELHSQQELLRYCLRTGILQV